MNTKQVSRTIRITRRLALSFLPIIVFGSTAWGDATDDVIKDALKTFSSKASLFSLIGECPQYANMTAGSCELADILGQGLVCPPLTPVDASQEAERGCAIQFKNQVSGSIGLGATARLKASDIDSYEFKMTYKPMLSLARHLHDGAATPGGTDPDSWYKRKDRVQMYAAIYDGSEVSATVPIPSTVVPLTDANNPVVSFTAEVKSEQGAAVAWEGIVCGKVEHVAGPRSCPVEEEEEETAH